MIKMIKIASINKHTKMKGYPKSLISNQYQCWHPSCCKKTSLILYINHINYLSY